MLLHDVEQGSLEWFALRAGVATASEFSRIVTASGKQSASADAYIAELIDEIARPMASRSQEEQATVFSGNRHTERGHLLEPKAKAWLEFVLGKEFLPGGFITSDDGLLGCSPDARLDGEGCEFKAPEGKKHVLWMMGGGLPDEHKQQVHGSMVVTGERRWNFLSYCPGYAPFHVVVEWDSYTDAMAKILDEFNKKHAAARAAFIDYLPENLKCAA